MSDDIVARLLRIDRVGVPSILTEAADELERLRAEIERLRARVAELEAK